MFFKLTVIPSLSEVSSLNFAFFNFIISTIDINASNDTLYYKFLLDLSVEYNKSKSNNWWKCFEKLKAKYQKNTKAYLQYIKILLCKSYLGLYKYYRTNQKRRQKSITNDINNLNQITSAKLPHYTNASTNNLLNQLNKTSNRILNESKNKFNETYMNDCRKSFSLNSSVIDKSISIPVSNIATATHSKDVTSRIFAKQDPNIKYSPNYNNNPSQFGSNKNNQVQFSDKNVQVTELLSLLGTHKSRTKSNKTTNIIERSSTTTAFNNMLPKTYEDISDIILTTFAGDSAQYFCNQNEDQEKEKFEGEGEGEPIFIFKEATEEANLNEIELIYKIKSQCLMKWILFTKRQKKKR